MKYIFSQGMTGQAATLAKTDSVENCKDGKSHTCENPQCGKSHSVENCKGNALSNNNINALSVSNINALSDNKEAPAEEKPKEAKPKKETKKKETPDYSKILDRIEDSELRVTYIEFIKMRNFIKKPLTEYAFERIIAKVEALAPKNTILQKAILDQSIERNWQGVFPLKEDTSLGNVNGYQQYGTPCPVSDTDNIFLTLLREEQAKNGGQL
jgi:hypothetical protein